MAANSFGKLFKITTFGESHGPAIGVIIDGCPAGLKITKEEINQELCRRKTAQNLFTSQRKEPDTVEILSGIVPNQTTGAPIALLIENQDFSSYEKIKELYRPGHANFTYLHKYGLFDFAGAGRASARGTAVWIAAGAIAKKLLKKQKIQLCAFLSQVGPVKLPALNLSHFSQIQKKVSKSSLFCPNAATEKAFISYLTELKKEKDTIGGTVQLISTSLPIGLGNPVFEKLSASLAKACFSIPAVKGFEIGEGINSAFLKGSQMNDLLTLKNQKLTFKTNRCGGMLGGISNGSFLDLKVTFKPISTIGKKQPTYNLKKEQRELSFENLEKHDLCAALRAPPIVEAMTALVLIDAWLINQAYSSSHRSC